MGKTLNILLAAAENDGVKPFIFQGIANSCKVGGMADVVRDAPRALAALRCKVSVVSPSYGFLGRVPGRALAGSVSFPFRDRVCEADIHRVPGRRPIRGVRHFAVDHPAFTSFDLKSGRYLVYCGDPPDRPYATDANRFALFCAAVAEAVKRNLFGRIDVIHLHDWHTGLFLVLRNFHQAYESLRSIRTVFTIHNLAYQGFRPFRGDDSSLESWFGGEGFAYPEEDLADPEMGYCVNPMAVGIRFADAVHVVSPTYAEEILRPSYPPAFYGGERLEGDLLRARDENRLFGILNGCDYPPDRVAPRMDFQELLDFLRSHTTRALAGDAAELPARRLTEWIESRSERSQMVLTSVTRVAQQKLFLMKERGNRFESGLHGILRALDRHGTYILLGTGDPWYADFLRDMSRQFDNFVFLEFYSNECAEALYANGDLFVMPSSYEPCGIGQMLAMRDGQPCLVHRIGGLGDTVRNGVDGFAFQGFDAAEKVDNFVLSFREALEIRLNDPDRWEGIRANAAANRFEWKTSVAGYLTKLYA
jgi:starch synthase